MYADHKLYVYIYIYWGTSKFDNTDNTFPCVTVTGNAQSVMVY